MTKSGLGDVIVVYFDQRMHACSCIHMVKNNKKMLENYQKNTFFFGVLLLTQREKEA